MNCLKTLLQEAETILRRREDVCTQRQQSIQPFDDTNTSYTSGITADSKGIILIHPNYTANTKRAFSLTDLTS